MLALIENDVKRLLHWMVLAETLALALAVLPLHGQTAVSPYRALHPIMPDPNQRAAPSSVILPPRTGPIRASRNDLGV